MGIADIFMNDPLGPKVREISLRDRERLFFLMAMMLKSGETAESGLRNVAKAFKAEKKDSISTGLLGIAQKVAQGRSLSKAMETEYIMFGDVHRAAIMAGEAANNMLQAFTMLQKLEDKKIEASRSGIAELLTPGALFVLSIASIFNTGLNTLPSLARVREAQGKEPSAVTNTVIAITHSIAEYWYVLLAGFIIFIIMAYSTIRTTEGRFWLDFYTLRLPIVGKYIAYKVYTSMLLYFPPMIESGVKPKQMIPIMEALATNVALRRKIDSFNKVITTGGSMSAAMEKAGFPPIAVTPVRVSENYAGDSDGVNDVMIEGLHHAYTILDRILSDVHKRFIGTFSAMLWIMGGATMLMEMLSVVFAQN